VEKEELTEKEKKIKAIIKKNKERTGNDASKRGSIQDKLNKIMNQNMRKTSDNQLPSGSGQSNSNL